MTPRHKDATPELFSQCMVYVIINVTDLFIIKQQYRCKCCTSSHSVDECKYVREYYLLIENAPAAGWHRQSFSPDVPLQPAILADTPTGYNIQVYKIQIYKYEIENSKNKLNNSII